nr:MAG TPA: hypothetical protein [Caudoviricetes sp.]
MLKTTKYEFGKPEQNDFYDINVHNNNMDEIERALTEFDDSGKAEGITSFTDMFTKLATGNKLAVTLRNLKAGLQFCLHVGSIVNNCVTDNARLPLSAAQGKVLMDAVTKLNSEIGYIQNYDIDTLSSPSQLTHSGYYQFVNCSSTVNDNASTKFTDYQTGDFVGLLITRNGYATSDAGCQWGTFIITSPRFTNKFWIGRIWGYKFVNFIKIGS